MDQLGRLLPYVWRYRSKVSWSIFFAVLVAGLWAATWLVHLATLRQIDNLTEMFYKKFSALRCKPRVKKRTLRSKFASQITQALAYRR